MDISKTRKTGFSPALEINLLLFQTFRPNELLCFADKQFDELANYHYTIQKHSKSEVPMYDQKALTKRYPTISFGDPKMQGCVDKSAGILYADRCLKALQVNITYKYPLIIMLFACVPEKIGEC